MAVFGPVTAARWTVLGAVRAPQEPAAALHAARRHAVVQVREAAHSAVLSHANQAPLVISTAE